MLAPNPSMEFESEILLTGNPDSGQKQRALAIIAGVDAFLDMGRTAINVFGNTVAVKLVEKFSGDLLIEEEPLVGEGQPAPIALQTRDA